MRRRQLHVVPFKSGAKIAPLFVSAKRRSSGNGRLTYIAAVDVVNVAAAAAVV